MFYVARSEIDTIEAGLRGASHSLSIALDREFQSSIGSLNALASSQFLDSGNFREFYALCEQARAIQPAWDTIVLHEPSGKPILDLVVPFGAPLPSVLEKESFETILQTKKAAVLEMVKAPSGGWVFGIGVPVVRGGEVKYVLSALLQPTWPARIMEEQRLPSSWAGVIYDQRGHVVARTHSADSLIRRETSILKGVVPGATDGLIHGYNHEGVYSYSYFHRSAFSGWYVVVNVADVFLDSPIRRPLIVVIGAGLIALLFGIVFAFSISKRISDSVRSIKNLAQAIGLGKKINDVEKCPISELNTITDALQDASNLLQESAAKQRQAEADLRDANNRLEQRVSERTAALFEEIRKKERAEESLRSQALLLQHTHDAIIVRDFKNGKIQFWNNGAAEMYGWKEEEVMGKDIHELLQSRFPEPYKDIEDKVARYGRWEGEVVQMRKDQTELILGSRWSLRRDGDGLPAEVLELNSDITSRKYAEQKVQENEWLASLGTASAMFAHEIGNPLDGISSSLQLLEVELNRNPEVDIRVQKIVEILTEEIQRLGLLVNEFRAVARPQVINSKPSSLVGLINEVLVPQIAVCANAGITVKREFNELPPVLLDGDKMKQVILNLCKNAIEAMPQGGVLTLRTFQSQELVVLEISDTGVGIPQGMDVFQLFTTTKRNGSGLGLPVVRQIIAAHNGHIEYASEFGRGTTFKIYLRGCFS